MLPTWLSSLRLPGCLRIVATNFVERRQGKPLDQSSSKIRMRNVCAHQSGCVSGVADWSPSQNPPSQAPVLHQDLPAIDGHTGRKGPTGVLQHEIDSGEASPRRCGPLLVVATTDDRSLPCTYRRRRKRPAFSTRQLRQDFAPMTQAPSAPTMQDGAENKRRYGNARCSWSAVLADALAPPCLN